MTLPDLNMARTVSYWLALCPEASITDELLDEIGSPYPVASRRAEGWANQLLREGYFQTDPIVPEDQVEAAAEIVSRVTAVGLPGPFALVYDELWLVIHRLSSLVRTILGNDVVVVPDFWVWCVDGRREPAGWPPHRDDEVAVPFDADGRPNIVTMWLALSEASTMNSCIYVLPKHHDRQRLEGSYAIANEDLPFVRALPIPAGAVLGWDQHLLHWGSAASHRAERPRISLGIYIQKAKVEQQIVPPLPRAGPIPLVDRLGWIGRMVQKYPKGVDPVILELCRSFDLLRRAVASSESLRKIRQGESQ